MAMRMVLKITRIEIIKNKIQSAVPPVVAILAQLEMVWMVELLVS